ncbi:hypothetical protein NPIL_273281 [Nephila pilipes]|uniref:Uncharacterized protein n=1 Tax=Nephila pilipes TaxID=299642 RepID=A0A8X6NHM0_NEPPI|nr:hypothetical protein NPIL_273281 [Nephila pilipes]
MRIISTETQSSIKVSIPVVPKSMIPILLSMPSETRRLCSSQNSGAASYAVSYHAVESKTKNSTSAGNRPSEGTTPVFVQHET